MREFSRSQRVAGQLQREIAGIVQREIKDPRLGFVTISDVEVTKDFSHANVFFTVLNSTPEKKDETLAVLTNSAGFMRHLLGKSLKIRVIPQLHFKYDASIEHGAALNDLIAQANAKDKDSGE